VQGQPDEYGPDQTHEFLVDFMQRRREQPFFVYYSAVLAHVPLVPTPDTKPGTDDAEQLVLDMVSYLDKLVGRLVADLDRLGLRDKTVLLFTSDNGPFGKPLGTIRGAPMVGAKGDVAEGGVREPLIVNCPALVPAGRVCADLTDFTDLFPTVLELAGVEPPRELKLDGRSIAPQILGRPGTPREWVYAQHGREYFIADRRFKLYADGRFVDIADSPVAERPVTTDDAEAAQARHRLAAALAKLRADAPALQPSKPSPLSDRQWKADLQLLADRKLIAAADDWPDRSDIAGEQVAALLLRAAGHFQPATTSTEQAIAVLQQEGVLNSPDYWKKHAVAGQKCSAQNVARLVNKLATRLQSPRNPTKNE
jgi:arylsulfatase A-like enzyme